MVSFWQHINNIGSNNNEKNLLNMFDLAWLNSCSLKLMLLGGAVAVVVVVCVGFLLVLLVIGVLKMRDAPLPKKRRNRKPTQVCIRLSFFYTHGPKI
jgi:ABC-type phosphate transport system auxiliary subunit